MIRRLNKEINDGKKYYNNFRNLRKKSKLYPISKERIGYNLNRIKRPYIIKSLRITNKLYIYILNKILWKLSN